MSDVKETLEFVGDELPSGVRAHFGKYERMLEPLMERPGEWARIMTGGKSVGVRIASLQNANVRMPPGEWEFARRTMPDDEVHGFARYMGSGTGDEE